MTDRKRHSPDYDSRAYEPGSGRLGFATMIALGHRGGMLGPYTASVPHFYGGTVPRHEVDERRRKTKAARKARVQQRRRAARR